MSAQNPQTWQVRRSPLHARRFKTVRRKRSITPRQWTYIRYQGSHRGVSSCISTAVCCIIIRMGGYEGTKTPSLLARKSWRLPGWKLLPCWSNWELVSSPAAVEISPWCLSYLARRNMLISQFMPNKTPRRFEVLTSIFRGFSFFHI